MQKEGLMQVAVDAVVFTAMHDELKILLIQRNEPPFKGKWALPGGFVEKNEELENAAQRELYEETNVRNIFMQKIGAYGAVGRDPRGRVLSVAYLALISAGQKLKTSRETKGVEWHSLNSLPGLGFDHKNIVRDALNQLRFEIQTTNIAFQILPKKFTLSEMQHLYQLVLGKKLDKRNFRKKIKELGILKETHETKMEGAHRPAMLYSFRESKYVALKEKISVLLPK